MLSHISTGYAWGITFIVTVAIFWSGSSVLVQYLYRDYDLHSPFVVTYIGVSLFTLWLPLQWITNFKRKYCCGSTCCCCCYNDDTQQSQLRQDGHGNGGVKLSRSERGLGIPSSSSSSRRQQQQQRYMTLESSAPTTAECSSCPVNSPATTTNRLPPIHSLTSTATAATATSTIAHRHSTVSTIDDLTTVEPRLEEEMGENNDEEEEDEEEVDEEECARRLLELLHWTEWDHFVTAVKIAPVWFVANWTYNASLQYTSITSSTVLASTGSLFTLLFAVLSADENFTSLKLAGVLLGVFGSMLTALNDADDGTSSSNSTTTTMQAIFNDDDIIINNYNLTSMNASTRLYESTALFLESTTNATLDAPFASSSFSSTTWFSTDALWGDALGLVSAIGYGAYAVQTRLLCPHDESLYSMQTVLGYIGLVNFVCLLPVAIYTYVQNHHDDNHHPNDGGGNATSSSSTEVISFTVLGCLIVKGFFDNFLSDYLWMRAVILTTATTATVGLGLTIPMAFFCDWMVASTPTQQSVLTVTSVAGAVLVLAGFVLVNLGNDDADVQVPPAAVTYDILINSHSERADGHHRQLGHDERHRRHSYPLSPSSSAALDRSTVLAAWNGIHDNDDNEQHDNNEQQLQFQNDPRDAALPVSA